MSKGRLELITENYWLVSQALRDPSSAALSCEKALHAINSSDRLRPDEWRLRELVHTLRFDIIEGNTEWRANQRVRSSAPILPMKG